MAHSILFLVLAATIITTMTFADETRFELRLSARNLPDSDDCCLPGVHPADAYAKVYYAPSDFDNYLYQSDTSVLSDNNNPDWPEDFGFFVQDGSSARIKIEVWDSDIGNDQSLGFTEFHLSEVESAFGHVLEKELTGSSLTNGQLRVAARINGTRSSAFDDLIIGKSSNLKVIEIPVPFVLPTIHRMARDY